MSSKAERVPHGGGMELFRVGLSTLWDDIESSGDDDDPGTTGIKAFDNLRTRDWPCWPRSPEVFTTRTSPARTSQS